MKSAPTLPPRSPEEQTRVEAAISDLFENKVVFNTALGIRVESFDPARPTIGFDMQPILVGHYVYGQLHGGAIAAALDGAAGFALMVAIAERYRHETAEQIVQRFARISTIDLRIDYLRPGIGQHFHASARVNRMGGRIASLQLQLENEHGTLIATGAAVFAVS